MESHPNRRHDDDMQYSRSVDGGKKNSKVESRVSDELKEAVRRKWMDCGFSSESEYIEKLCAISVWGAEHVRMMEERKINRVSLLSDTAQSASSFPAV